MNVTFACPGCGATVRQDFDDASTSLGCPRCGKQITLPRGGVESGCLHRCLVCPSHDLYLRKDFPQRLGVLLVAVGVVGSSIAWRHANLAWTFGILFATALADLLLFALVGSALMCYRCGAHYRGAVDGEAHGQF